MGCKITRKTSAPRVRRPRPSARVCTSLCHHTTSSHETRATKEENTLTEMIFVINASQVTLQSRVTAVPRARSQTPKPLKNSIPQRPSACVPWWCLNLNPRRHRRAIYLLNTVITAGTSAGFTSGYDTGVRLRSDGLSFFGRFAVCPLVAFFRGCLAARTVNVIGVPIVIAIVIVRVGVVDV